MAFCSFAKEYSSAATTDIENIFIYEYLPDASGEAVKVYLYGLFLCQNSEFDMNLPKFAENVKLPEETVVQCFRYWEEFGAVLIAEEEPFHVQFLPLRKAVGSKPRKIKPEKYAKFTAALQPLLAGRMIGTSEYSEYFNVMETYNLKPEALLMIVKYCADRKGNDIGYRYILSVARDFGKRGINTEEKVEKELSAYVLRTAELEKLLRALNAKRQPEPEDLNYLNKWTKELGFDYDTILYAAGKVKKSSIAKLDEFIAELYAHKRFSKREIQDYLDNKRSIYELAVKINKALSVYYEVLDTVVDNYTSRWLNSGYREDALLLIANYCFKHNRNTLEEMDTVVNALCREGLISLESIAEYFRQSAIDDRLIRNILETVGIGRNPNSWDRKNLKLWKSWNFTDEMILEAAKAASGKASPIAYINAILGNWKNANVFSPDQIAASAPKNGKTQHFANEHKYSKEELDAIIDDVATLEF